MPLEAGSLGKRLLKSYFAGEDLGLLSRMKFQRDKLQEEAKMVTTFEQHALLKSRWRTQCGGVVKQLEEAEAEESEHDQDSGNFSDGEEEEDFEEGEQSFDDKESSDDK